MNWTGLIKNRYDNDTLVKGKYFVIKFTPDFVANEVLNIGVALIDENENIYYQLLDNIQGFECLYGKKSLEIINLLFSSVEQSLRGAGYFSSPSPHIIYTPLIPTSGLSVETILKSLYQDYIHLDHYSNLEKQKKVPALSTREIRKNMFAYFNKNNKALYDSYVCFDKVTINSDLNSTKSIELDLPIWRKRADSLFNQQPLFATVVSADYIDEASLSLNLDYLGSTCIRNACELIGKQSKAGLFVYRPTTSERITEKMLTNINNHIDSALYSLERMKSKGYDIDIKVLEDKESIFEMVENFVY